jgi:hypothetical protein
VAQKKTFTGYPVYRLYVPKSTKWQPQQALLLMETLLRAFPSVALQVYATNEGVEWRVIDLLNQPNRVSPALMQANYPQLQVDIEFFEPIPHEYKPKTMNSFQYVLRALPWFPLLYVDEIGRVDPLAAIAQGMSFLQEGEKIIYTLIVHQQNKPLAHLGMVLLNRGGKLDTSRPRYPSHREALYESKLNADWYECFFLVGIEVPANKGQRIDEITKVISPQLAGFARNAPGEDPNELWFYRWRDWQRYGWGQTGEEVENDITLDWYATILQAIATPKMKTDFKQEGHIFLSSKEIAALWHLPHEGFDQARVIWAKKVVSIPDAVARSTAGIYIGRGVYQGNDTHVRVLPQDDIGHTAILGKSGFGKSTLLHTLIHQRIKAGKGIAVIDPHGSLVQAILQTSIPQARERDVVILDLANANYPPPLNPLRGIRTSVSSGRVADLISTLFPETEQRVRVRNYLNAALVALEADDSPTIRDLSRIFTHDSYRMKLLEKLDEFEHAQALEVWELYELEKPTTRPLIYEPIISRISPFYQKKELYPALCHPDGLNFQQLIRDRKIILISLKMDEEQVSEPERNLVGSLLISALQLAGMKQASDPFYVYVDEAEKFVTTSLNVLLSEARKFGMSLTLANQYAGQLSGETLQAVEGNVTTTICFGCGLDDARAFAPYFEPEFTRDDLLNLDKFEAIVKLQYQGQSQPAFTLYPYMPLKASNQTEALENERRIRTLSQQLYTPKSLDEIKRWLRERYPRPKASNNEDEEDPRFG